MKEIIHFAHGNGFPALCYKQMLDYLAVDFDCCFIDKIGHDSLFPVTDNWHDLVLELISSIKKQSSQPVIAVGHSLGGVLSLLAAIQEPALIKAVILLDSPLINPLKSLIVKMAKTLKFIDRITPAFKMQGRRQYWENYPAVVQYLKTRDLFSTFSNECFDDYIAYGLEHQQEGYYLRFDRHIEYQIYRTIPHDLATYTGKLFRPAALIYGDKSRVIDTMDLRYMRKKFHIKSYKTRGTHLFPMEDPKACAALITKVITAII